MAYANPDAVTQIANGLSTTTFTYDNNGNVTQKTTDGTSTTYVYHYANRLTALGVGGATTTYAYDWVGNRVSQTGTTTTYLYPFKWYSVASSTGTGAKFATTTDYVWTPSADTLVATVDQQFASGVATGTSKTRYIHPDHLGSTNVVTDASGTVVQTLDYYPYGSTRISTNVGGADSARKYIGQFADQSNLDYLNTRYYDSSRGQFLSEDSVFLGIDQNLKDPQGLNAYSHAEDNPITKFDPLGLAATIAQQISVLQAQINILQGIVNLFKGGFTQGANAAFTAYQTAFGSGTSETPGNSSSVQNRTTSIPNATACYINVTPNITPALQSQMIEHSNDQSVKSGFSGMFDFYKKEKNNGDWDLKQTDEFNSETYASGFVHDDKNIRNDAPGNIHYGYVGASTDWASPGILLGFAGAAQIKAGTSQLQWINTNFHGDDPVDQINILWGMNMYYNR